jgi:hypothetical protein
VNAGGYFHFETADDRAANWKSKRLQPALNYFAYNFIKIHRTLRISPAMAAGVTERLWSGRLGCPLGSRSIAEGGKSGIGASFWPSFCLPFPFDSALGGCGSSAALVSEC